MAAAVEHANATWVADEDAAAAFDEQLQNDVSPNSRQRARTSEVEHPAPDARELAGAESSLELLEHRGASSNGCDAIDKGDGTYNLTALATVAGKYTVHAFVNGRPAMAPFPYIVKPGQPDPATSELTIGSTRGTIGRWVPLRILARDAFGNIADGSGIGAPSDPKGAGGAGGGGKANDGGIEVHVMAAKGVRWPWSRLVTACSSRLSSLPLHASYASRSPFRPYISTALLLRSKSTRDGQPHHRATRKALDGKGASSLVRSSRSPCMRTTRKATLRIGRMITSS